MSAPQPDARPRRSWVPMLVAVDTFLVAAVLVVAVVVTRPPARTAPPETGPEPGVSATGTRSAPTPAPTSTPGPSRFRLPSGNIACDMADEGVTCTIASITFTPPEPPEPCGGVHGHTVLLDAGGVDVPCLDPPAPTVVGNDVPTLSYGASSTVGAYTCRSATNGVTCTGAGGVGFRLQRSALTLLP